MSHQEYLERCNWEVHQPDASPFDLLNTAFMDSGICITIEEGNKIDVPLRMLNITSGVSGTMVSPRVYIDVEESCSMQLIEQHVGHAGEYFCNQSTIISIEKNARLDLSLIHI